MKVRAAFFLACLVFLLGAPSAAPAAGQKEPSLKSFYDQARLIMTDEEAKVFRSLPNDKARAEFMDEFWAIRDPNPGTPENKAKTEFENRTRYAALWFGTANPYRGKDPGGPLKYTGGWRDERGRVYVLLGKPDFIIFFDGVHETMSPDGSRSRLESNRWVIEEWIYNRLNTYVVFSRLTRGLDDSQAPLQTLDPGQGQLPSRDQSSERPHDRGDWYLESFQANFLDVLEWAKLNWTSSETQGDIRTWFRFNAAFGPKGLQITIPVDRVSTDDHFKVALGVQVNVYRGNVKVDEIRLTKELEETRENLFDDKNLWFGIPYSPPEKGSYLFDIIIQDKMAKSASKYRVLLRQKL